MSSNDFESLAEAAARYGVSTKTLRRYIAEGRITGYRMGPQILRVKRSEVDALLQPIPTVGTAPGPQAA